mmetsp:Transcript_14293/g.31308  ORF Transcript_14293/g.31308 Transcript_14293/m.31308 type:complete len:115 (+) Transcript_14293:328-672(+)
MSYGEDSNFVRTNDDEEEQIFAEFQIQNYSIQQFSIQFCLRDWLTLLSSRYTSQKAQAKPLDSTVPCDDPSTATPTPSELQSNCIVVPFVAAPFFSTPSKMRLSKAFTSDGSPL